MDSKQKKIAWCCQIVAASILLIVGVLKFLSDETDVFIFSELKMEPMGRYFIGFLEVLAGIFLFSELLAALGALLGVGVMCGAILAHITVLGVSVAGDEGRHLILLALVFLSCGLALYLRRRQLPIIGRSFS